MIWSVLAGLVAAIAFVALCVASGRWEYRRGLKFGEDLAKTVIDDLRRKIVKMEIREDSAKQIWQAAEEIDQLRKDQLAGIEQCLLQVPFSVLHKNARGDVDFIIQSPTRVAAEHIQNFFAYGTTAELRGVQFWEIRDLRETLLKSVRASNAEAEGMRGESPAASMPGAYATYVPGVDPDR